MELLADALTRDELSRVLDAARKMARVSGGDDLTSVLDELLAITAAVTESDRVGYYRLEDQGTMLVLSHHVPADRQLADAFRRLPVVASATGRTLTSGRAATFPTGELGVSGTVAEASAIRHIAVLPLHVASRPTGTLNLARHGERPYSAAELRVAELVAELFVVYVEHAQLYGDARRRLDETRMLLDVSRAVTASLELDRRLEASADVLTRMVDASNGFVLLLEDYGTVLRGVATSNALLADHFKGVRIPMTAASIAVRAVKTKKPVVVEDLERASEVRRDLVEAYGEKSVLALPLVVGSEAIGAVVLDDTRAIRSWSSAEIARAELIAHQIAGAVATARLYEEIRSRSTELERAQQALVARERLAALGQLAATLAHEVRNPLGVLFNSIGTLRKLLTSGGDAVALLGIMDEEARRLDRLVRELLEFAKPVVPSFESESLRHVVDGALDSVAAEIGTDGPMLSATIAEDMPPLRIDASQIRRALVNLVRNAAQAAGQGGAVAVRAGLDRQDGRDLARIEVVDTGPGIPSELVGRVFEPFFTTKATGTGLGLAIVKSIVEGHGGEVSLGPPDGSGTTVTVLLPIADEGAPALPADLRRPGW